ncbi:hypothetical protein, partial [Burkholderia multivorans]|uniref:hypothetical protein n=1 Tax=Burkholderia multivorans TaxID=87883 RepID=UPI0021C18A7A
RDKNSRVSAGHDFSHVNERLKAEPNGVCVPLVGNVIGMTYAYFRLRRCVRSARDEVMAQWANGSRGSGAKAGLRDACLSLKRGLALFA